MLDPSRPAGDPDWPLAPKPLAQVHDAALDGWAHFGFGVHTGLGPGNAFTGYDREQHRYKSDYVRPAPYALRVDATLGLRNGPRPLVLRADPIDRPRPVNVNDIRDLLRPRPPDIISPEPGHPLLPDDLVAFEWTVTGEAGFRDAATVGRIVSPPSLAYLTLPGTGTYTLRLRVVFAGGRYGERSVVFVLRDFLIVSIGDSSASGEGNPDFAGDPTYAGRQFCGSTTVSKVLEPLLEPWPVMANDPIWVEPLAHRSAISGPTLAALSLQQQAHANTLFGPHGGFFTLDNITYLTFARSGEDR
ncbi:MAG TPA: hypothetical protein VFB74_33225 [Kribbellaceae bacterium]|nr:hypothetical protein [Kribbellaceae bacterium]